VRPGYFHPRWFGFFLEIQGHKNPFKKKKRLAISC
jgi:hypothetical protein